MKTLSLLVVGVGHIGRLHARKIRDFAARGEAVELLGVVDTDAAALARVSEELACPAFRVAESGDVVGVASLGAGVESAGGAAALGAGGSDGSVGSTVGVGAESAGGGGAVASGTPVVGAVASGGVSGDVGDAASAGATAAAECFARADAAVVATPTALHAQSAAHLLSQGLDLLVEKPIAASCEEAERLVDAARTSGRVLQVGHVEWFSPALRRARPHLARPQRIIARRHNPVPQRGVRDDVVCDLMIHDIDIVQRVLGETPQRIESSGRIGRSGLVDAAEARLLFPSGAEAQLSAERTRGESVRDMVFHQEGARLRVDFLKQEAGIEQDGAGAPQRLDAEPGTEGAQDDPLEAQLRAFLNAVRERRVRAGTGEQARDALHTALRILDGIRENAK